MSSLRDALDEALDLHDGRTGPDVTDYFMARLLGARIEEFEWAFEFFDLAARERAQRLLKNRARQRDIVHVSYDGKLLTKSGRGGIRVIDPSGSTQQQQWLFEDMSREQFFEWEMEQQRIYDGVGVNLYTAKRLRQLLDLHPDAQTLGAAAREQGTTIEDWLEATA